MTRQEIMDLIEQRGENEIGTNGNVLFTMPSTEIFYIADVIIAHQNEQLKEFVEWWLKSLDEGIQFWETQENKHIATQMLDSIKNEMMCLIDCYQKFLEETSDDNK